MVKHTFSSLLILTSACLSTHCRTAGEPRPVNSPSAERVTEALPTATPMDFPTTESFTRQACSPEALGKAAKSVAFNIRTELDWGEALFVCGHLRFPKEDPRPAVLSSLSVQIRNSESEEFIHDSPNFQLGSPPLRENEELYTILKRDGELYFNARVESEYTVLAPGTYDVSVSFFDTESERKRLKVVAAGWRRELAEFLSKELCDGQIAEDFKDYLSIQQHLRTADMDQAQAAQVYGDMREAAKTAMLGYRQKLPSSWLEGLQQTPEHDVGIPEYLWSLLGERCPAKTPSRETAFDLYQAFRMFP